jgi:hypothetical protein
MYLDYYGFCRSRKCNRTAKNCRRYYNEFQFVSFYVQLHESLIRLRCDLMSLSFVNVMRGAAICWSKVDEDGASPIFVSLLRSVQSSTKRSSMRILHWVPCNRQSTKTSSFMYCHIQLKHTTTKKYIKRNHPVEINKNLHMSST